MKKQNLVIIGNGVAAKVLIFELSQLDHSYNIIQIDGSSYIPPCSMNTTSINCLRGTQKGLSPLGDMIVDSYQSFENFIEEYQPFGVTKSSELQTWKKSSSKQESFEKRFAGKYKEVTHTSYFNKEISHDILGTEETCYIIEPESYFSWFDSNSSIRRVDSLVTEITESQVQLLNKEIINFDKLVFCTSYKTIPFNKSFSKEASTKLKRSKPVAGTYLEIPELNFDLLEFNKLENGFSFVIEQAHFIYRPISKSFIIGSTSTNDSELQVHNELGIKVLYQLLASTLEGVISFPEFNPEWMKTGIRHKGQKRMPFWGKVNDNVYSIYGLYKNAFTFAHLAAESVAQDLILLQKLSGSSPNDN